MSCRRYRPLLVDAAVGEPDPTSAGRLDRHLAACRPCAAALDDLRAALALADAAGVREPSAAALDRVWERLAPRLDTAADGGRLVPFPTRSWRIAALAAAGVVLVLGLAIELRRPTSPAASRPPGGTGERPAATLLGRDIAAFLDRSTPLLLSVANRDVERDAAAGILEPAAERAAARRLADEAATLLERLDRAGGDGEQELVASLERLFLQLANLPDRQYPEGVAVVRAAVERDAILFQLTAGELLRARARRPSAAV